MSNLQRRVLNLRFLGRVMAAALVVQPMAARADVIGIGDHVPAHEVDGEAVSDLPQFGVGPGDSPVPLIVVGGTFGFGGNIDPGIGGTATGQMTIDIPSETFPLISDVGIIGGNIFGLGLVRLIELNSEWRVNETLTVGNEGQGFLEIISGSRVASDVDGVGAEDPSDELTAGGYDLVLGAVEGSQGSALIDGFASLMVGTNTSVGQRGLGNVHLLNRGRMVTRIQASVGTEVEKSDNAVGTGYVLVEGQGTRWTVGITVPDNSTTQDDGFDGVLIVGNEGRGTVEIRDQGWVSVETDVVLGEEPGSRGEVIVTGQNSLLWALEDMFVGNNATLPANQSEGELTIGDRAVARADGVTNIGTRGFVEFRGGTLLSPETFNFGVMRGDGWVTSNSIINNGDIRNAAALANQRERLTFSGSVVNNFGAIIESVGGEMEFQGPVANGGQIFGKDAILRFQQGVTGAGDVSIDNTVIESPIPLSVAALTVGPSTSQVIGSVNLTGMNITLGDDHSLLWVTGMASVDGPLAITLEQGYRPAAGDSFEILRADNGYNGTFAGVAPVPGYTFTVDYSDPGSIFVNFAGAGPAFAADFNNDGMVDALDMGIWKLNFGLAPATMAQGDANGDAVVDGDDFLVIQEEFGSSTAAPVASPNASTVPEPGGLALAAAICWLPLCRRRRC